MQTNLDQNKYNSNSKFSDTDQERYFIKWQDSFQYLHSLFKMTMDLVWQASKIEQLGK